MRGCESECVSLCDGAYRRVVDRLHIDAVDAHQAVGRGLALARVANQHRHNVRLRNWEPQMGVPNEIIQGEIISVTEMPHFKVSCVRNPRVPQKENRFVFSVKLTLMRQRIKAMVYLMIAWN